VLAYLLLALGAWAYAAIVDREPLFGDAALTIIYANGTDEALQFYGQYEGKPLWKDELVPPNTTKTATWMVTTPTIRILATRPDGLSVFDKTYRWDELRRAGGRVSVSSLQPIGSGPTGRRYPSYWLPT
jgi:hypothetical protein